MKKTEKSFLTLSLCLIAALFIGLTAIACDKKNHTDINQTKSITINNATGYDLTNIHLIYNNNSAMTSDLEAIRSNNSVTADLPETEVYSVAISGKTSMGQTFSGSFSGLIDNDSSITVSIDESSDLSTTSNIAD